MLWIQNKILIIPWVNIKKIKNTNLKKPDAVIWGGSLLNDQDPVIIQWYSWVSFTWLGSWSQYGRSYPEKYKFHHHDQIPTLNWNPINKTETSTHQLLVALSKIRTSIDNDDSSWSLPIAYCQKDSPLVRSPTTLTRKEEVGLEENQINVISSLTVLSWMVVAVP